MPTLFNREDILSGEEKEATIYFSELYELPEGMDDPYITIKITDEVREFQKRAWQKYLKPRILSRRDAGFELHTSERKLEYVMQMLKKCMIKTEHLFDDNSFDVMRKKFSRSKTIVTFLAERITNAFEDDGLKLKEQEEDDEKN